MTPDRIRRWRAVRRHLQSLRDELDAMSREPWQNDRIDHASVTNRVAQCFKRLPELPPDDVCPDCVEVDQMAAREGTTRDTTVRGTVHQLYHQEEL